MQLSKIGKIAQKYWLEIPKHFKNVYLDEFVIMPNHIHGIIILRDDIPDENKRKRQYQKIPIIIGSYKSSVTREINSFDKIYFQWQKSYHDRVIRSEDELNGIREYIKINPKKWDVDKENKNPD